MDDLERVELSAVLDFFAAAPPDVAHALDLAVLDLGEAAAFSIGAHPKMLLFNRVLGLERHVPPDIGAGLLRADAPSQSRHVPAASSRTHSTREATAWGVR